MSEKDQELPPVPAPENEKPQSNGAPASESEIQPENPNEPEERDEHESTTPSLKIEDDNIAPDEKVPEITVDDHSEEVKEKPQPQNGSNGHRTASIASPIKRKTSSVVTETASITFIKSSLEKIVTIKEIHKKHKDVEEACNKVIQVLKTNELPNEVEIFNVLRMTCEQSNIEAKIIALDCLGKIFTFNVFYEPTMIEYKKIKPEVHNDVEMEGASSSPANGTTSYIPLIEAAVDTISQCFEGEGTDERLELQVLRVLTSAILNESMPAHSKVLLQAIRQIYNIFLLSLSSANQAIAQANLTQIMNTVFEKIKSKSKAKNSRAESTVDFSVPSEDVGSEESGPAPEKVTLEAMKNITVEDTNFTSEEGDEDELDIKDAFLIFRSMSNLAVKAIENDSMDMRSHAIRSKLLSLHLIHWILKNHISCFLDKNCSIATGSGNEKTTLIDAARKYICLILSRNGTSALASVYEITLEIFWIMIKDLRYEFKDEIVVFFEEIYFPIGEIKTSTTHQKRYLLEIVYRISCDPKITTEIYLNYDCYQGSPDLCEKIVDYLTKNALTIVDTTPVQRAAYRESKKTSISTYKLSDLPSLSVNKMSSHPVDPDASLPFPGDYALQMKSIDALIAILQSWNYSLDKGTVQRGSIGTRTRSLTSTSINSGSAPLSPDASFTNLQLPDSADPTQFKQRKTALLEGIKKFNFKPSTGFKSFVANKFIDPEDPVGIARFLASNEAIDKQSLGEFLGEFDPKHVQIMHAFVELLNFENQPFVDALRAFLQSFRLPGEGQKIDRFMLKFADRYFEQNPGSFADAGTCYTLAFSIIMLNTDQHSSQIKKKMTLDEFIRNNRGIDDGKDIPREYLEEIFNEIANNEIILKSEQHAAMISSEAPTLGLFGGRGVAKEAYMKASKELSSKTEQLVTSLRNQSKMNGQKSKFETVSSNNVEQIVRSSFETLWMSILAGLTPPFKDHDDADTAKVLLDGIKISIHLSCLLDLDYARTSFIRALIQFCNLNNPEEIKAKNISAIYTMLDVAVSENSVLKESWQEILVAISQIERLKLLSQGVASDAVPDIINARLDHRASLESTRSNTSTGIFSSFTKKVSASEQASLNHFNQKLHPEIVSQISSTDLEVAVDKVFSNTSEITGNGIFDFIAALAAVARAEIKSSGQSEHPRLFSLQKMVDVCYYNMSRIRLEWSAIWDVMGKEFNEFGCHSNVHVVYFALDSLRQLSERFFEIEELAHFRFQQEFLKPYDYIIVNNVDIGVKTMVLDCVQYLIQKKSSYIRSGWITLLMILSHAAPVSNKTVVTKGFSYTATIAKKHFDDIYKYGGFESLATCIASYAKNEKFQITSLQAIEELKKLLKPISQIATQADTEKERESLFVKMWFPILFGLYDVMMTGEDLEARAMALTIMFESLGHYGSHFDSKFWDKVCDEMLFPIFDILKERWSLRTDQDDALAVWFSTTLIQALKKSVDLFSSYFDQMSHRLSSFLNLMVSSICQENDTISKSGVICLKDLVVNNASKFNDEQWEEISSVFADLFSLTTPKELFSHDPANSNSTSNANGGSAHNNDDDEEDDHGQLDDATNGDQAVVRSSELRERSLIVVKCVLQLHMIQTFYSLFEAPEVYDRIPLSALMRLCGLLEESYKFSSKFNDDYNLRVYLWNSGVIDKVPNLLKQETASSGVYISIMYRLYCDSDKAGEKERAEIVSKLVATGVNILEKFVGLNEREQARNITAWKPVVVEIIQAYTQLDKADFIKCCPTVYDLVIQLLDRNVNDLRSTMKEYLQRVGDIYVNEVDSSNGGK